MCETIFKIESKIGINPKKNTTQVPGCFGPLKTWLEAPSWIGNPLASLRKIFASEN